jgi:hypothetical protein
MQNGGAFTIPASPAVFGPNTNMLDGRFAQCPRRQPRRVATSEQSLRQFRHNGRSQLEIDAVEAFGKFALGGSQ